MLPWGLLTSCVYFPSCSLCLMMSPLIVPFFSLALLLPQKSCLAIGQSPFSLTMRATGLPSVQKDCPTALHPFCFQYSKDSRINIFFFYEKSCFCKVLQRRSGPYACNPRILGKEAGGLGVQGHPRLQSKLEARLSYMGQAGGCFKISTCILLQWRQHYEVSMFSEFEIRR